MTTTVIARLKRTKPIGDRRNLTVTAELHSISDQKPYFSVTAEERNLRRRGDNQIEFCGCMHDEVLKHWPDLAPVVALHLSDQDGVPMHAVANALYWAGIGKYSQEKVSTLASHLRVSETEAQSIISQVKSTTDPQKEMTGIVEIMSPRWKDEAVSALAKNRGRMRKLLLTFTALTCEREWTDFNGDEEHVCVLPENHLNLCRCRCGHDSEGNFQKSS